MTGKKMTRRRFLKDLSISCTCSSLFMNAFTPHNAMGADSQGISVKTRGNMEYRTLGKPGLKVSALSFGVMRLTEPAVLFQALEMGINYFDTAYVYQHGNNEKMLGSVLKQYGRKKVFIATKIPSYRRVAEKELLEETKSMENKVEESLRRLQTDYVDVLLLHSINQPHWAVHEDFLSFCDKQKKAGKARFVGISFHQAGQTYVDIVDQALKTDFYDMFLATFNYKSPQTHIEALKRARNKNVGIVAMKTQAGGYQEGSRVSFSPHQAALKWVLDCPFIDCAVPGMINREQLIENAGVIGKKVGWLDRRVLNAYYDAIKAHYCLRCGACTSSCRRDVDIPAIHRSLMYWEGYKDFNLAQSTYQNMTEKNNALACMSCSGPTCRCVNGIKITERMRYAHTVFK